MKALLYLFIGLLLWRDGSRLAEVYWTYDDTSDNRDLEGGYTDYDEFSDEEVGVI